MSGATLNLLMCRAGCTILCARHILTVSPDTHTKRKSTQHGCLPTDQLVGDGDKGIEIHVVYVEEKYILYRAD